MNILVTGGAGYIGSHTALALLEAGHRVLVVDNLCNSSAESLHRVAELAGRAPAFVQGDIRDRPLITTLLHEHHINAVVHLAGLKAVAESVANPQQYHDNNVTGSLCLLQAMRDAGVKRLVFSSSATVYGDPVFLPYTEDHPLNPANPYGMTKLAVENALRDLYRAQPDWRIAILRYFNPVGAHESGRIGEDPHGTPNNLMPLLAQVAAGKREKLQVYGNDYATPDGTGVRDYLHVMDLAMGHLRALDWLAHEKGVLTVNLGTGQGHSVLEMVKAFERASGCQVPYDIAPRRPGDIAAYYASCTRAEKQLGWKAARGIDDMCRDAWRWQQQNPNGY